MRDDLIEIHRKNYAASGAELVMGEGRFVGPKTIEVSMHDGAAKVVTGERIYLNLGTRAAIPDIPGLQQSRPLTHVEALELDYVPDHLIVLGGGYVGLEFAQPMRRFGSRVTVVAIAPEVRSSRTWPSTTFASSGTTWAVGGAPGELIAVVQTAMLADLPYTTLRDSILTHPNRRGLDGALRENEPVSSERTQQ